MYRNANIIPINHSLTHPIKSGQIKNKNLKFAAQNYTKL